MPLRYKPASTETVMACRRGWTDTPRSFVASSTKAKKPPERPNADGYGPYVKRYRIVLWLSGVIVALAALPTHGKQRRASISGDTIPPKELISHTSVPLPQPSKWFGR